ncbi:hypothetical protein L207DRAFT_525622 [Hyaloscypha variabilis F]|uniref:Uncharacterized protein n=1 Tax=Hyaloscypha variabilis (strain UAMH 11265 / GT02V1 / F) TaxID=1149755 RepID=A0A2J6S0H4_HYAVF|nr:hypothetical protein L207DRAFT_525622 [Hyaloscypha variabilis F]
MAGVRPSSCTDQGLTRARPGHHKGTSVASQARGMQALQALQLPAAHTVATWLERVFDIWSTQKYTRIARDRCQAGARCGTLGDPPPGPGPRAADAMQKRISQPLLIIQQRLHGRTLTRVAYPALYLNLQKLRLFGSEFAQGKPCPASSTNVKSLGKTRISASSFVARMRNCPLDLVESTSLAFCDCPGSNPGFLLATHLSVSFSRSRGWDRVRLHGETGNDSHAPGSSK